MQHVTVTTAPFNSSSSNSSNSSSSGTSISDSSNSMCSVTFHPTLTTGSVCPGFPCDAFSWTGRSIGGQVLTVRLSLNPTVICSFLSNITVAKECKELLPLCALEGAGRGHSKAAQQQQAAVGAGAGDSSSSGNGSSSAAMSAAAATAAGLFHCDADTVFARPDAKVGGWAGAWARGGGGGGGWGRMLRWVGGRARGRVGVGVGVGGAGC